MSGGADADVTRIAGLELIYAPVPWPYADANRAAIDAYFARLKAAKPALWNGRILLLHHYEIVGDLFRGMFLETDYASLRYWIGQAHPPAAIWDCFAAAAIRGSDGGWLTGVMGAHTANAGQAYFPCGTPDRDDISGDCVDFERSVARELAEETGFAVADFDAEPGWTLVRTGPHVVAVKVLHARATAAALRERVLANLARQRDPELADIRIVHGPADLDAAMPRFVHAFLIERWKQE
ncbi:MAG: NUDIX hydrolase [Xanthobacteraceae bacterium]|uniref:NUDIX hydrolase n=1 Tax=Pseudolabrys sp. TaxID=1960880 RepID=UPI003D13E906